MDYYGLLWITMDYYGLLWATTEYCTKDLEVDGAKQPGRTVLPLEVRERYPKPIELAESCIMDKSGLKMMKATIFLVGPAL